MTARQMLEKALKLLGYTGQNGNEQITRRIMNKATAIINAVYSDLWRIENSPDSQGTLSEEKEFAPIETLSDKILLSQIALSDVMPYGVAAFIAQSENEGDQQAVWMAMYNSKRASLSKTGRIVDVVQRSYDL